MRALMFVSILLLGLTFPGYADGDGRRYVEALMELVSASPEWEDCIDDVSTNTIEVLYPTMEDLFRYEMPSNYFGHGWSVQVKRQAFDGYLATLCITNGAILTANEMSLGVRALLCCRDKKYTNSITVAKNILKNSGSPYSRYAIELMLDMCRPTLEMNAIVLSVLTNHTSMTLHDRCTTMSSYLNVLGKEDEDDLLVKTNAASMFFSSRSLIENRVAVDRFMLSTYDDYATSSNRFLFANEVLSIPVISPNERAYFSSITNEIYSLK